MYPLGFMTIASYLKKHQLEVRIINLALKMLNQPGLKVEKFIKKLNPLAFGLDLHWLPHTHGCFEVAKLIKKHHPYKPTIIGGISASYYYQELINYPFVDYVIRGDSGEEPLRQLIESLKKKSLPEKVPNLVWKDKEGRVRINEFSWVPENLDGASFNYLEMIRGAIKYRDPAGYFPFQEWFRHPILALLPFKGCLYNCAFCGGGEKAFLKINRRPHLMVKSVSQLKKELCHLTSLFTSPIIVLGDLRQAGKTYVKDFFARLPKNHFPNHFIFELFYPADEEFLKMLKETFPRYNLQISPETHHEKIRKIIGKNYSNSQLEESISLALKYNCRRIDIFFLIGLPEQDESSVWETIDYCQKLLRKYHSEKRVHPYLAPLAPFLDPGSLIFENPEKYGYRLLARSLKDHYLLLEEIAWPYMLNYETKWLSRKKIADLTYQANLKLNQIKRQFGLISAGEFAYLEKQMKLARWLLEKIEQIRQLNSEKTREKKLAELKNFTKNLPKSSICVKEKLRWSPKGSGFKWGKIFKSLWFNKF
jgi:B12-binding domain/radical SAM domain protein